MQALLKHILFVLSLLVIGIPLADKAVSFIPAWELKGSFEKLEKPEFTWDGWFEGTFQSDAEAWLNENIGGREYFIRIRNQYYYSCFDIAKANTVTVGKTGVLMDAAYIDAFYGRDFAGEDFLIDKLKRWKRVERGLDSIGVKAFLALAPGKGSFFESDIPDKMRGEHNLTNYQYITNKSKELDIRLLDLKGLYHTWIDTSRYPLFPTGGIHWSEYGVAHVCDTLRGYIQNLNGNRLPEFWFDIEASDEPRGSDNDISEGMNLLVTPIQTNLVYPIRYFEEDSTLKPTHFLSIADSYYFNIFYSGFADRICSHGAFWYYYKQPYPGEIYDNKPLVEVDVLAELKKQDVLMLMMTEPQLPRFGWGAVESLEELLYPTQGN